MQKIIDIISELVENGLLKILGTVCSAVRSVFEYLNKKHDSEEKKETEKAEKNAEKQLNDACEKGDIKDLIDAAENIGKIKGKFK